MLTLSPKIQFQTAHKSESENLMKAVRERWMSIALTNALASMSIGGATKDELNGARKFIEVFLNLAEPLPPPTPLPPSKELGQPMPEKEI